MFFFVNAFLFLRTNKSTNGINLKEIHTNLREIRPNLREIRPDL